VCIIGGGVSGLATAITIGDNQSRTRSATSSDGGGTNTNGDEHLPVVLLEASPTVGGRVQSDATDDGYILDRGFAVFLEEYPNSKALLDYDALDLCRFDPGALVKLPGKSGLSRVADPLRQPKRLLDAAMSPVGTIKDKARLVPLLIHVMTKSIDEIFAEEETDTLTCLKVRWRFSESFIQNFLSPFLEGIYLTPLNQQSSRMFHFVFKMFSIGNVSLPRRGIGAVSEQLAAKAESCGVDIRTNCAVDRIRVEQEEEGFTITTMDNRAVHADNIVLATDVKSATRMISSMEGHHDMVDFDDEIIERSVGCLYYSFDSEAPLDEPILVLNGVQERGTRESPINNVCFPSVVCSDYSPRGSNLCSVSILESTLAEFDGKDDELDAAVRIQLSGWFPSHADAIVDPEKWRLKKIYRIEGAQPAQYGCSYPANTNGGMDATSFRGTKLPRGMFLAGDHISTSSLNGALGSGVNAGKAIINEMMG